MPAQTLQSASLLSLDQVCVKFGNLSVLHNISMQVHEGEVVSIIGPNGGGKSSLIKTILGFQPISSGTITKRTNLRIGYVPQNFHVPKHLPLRVCDFLDDKKLNQCKRLDLRKILELNKLWQSPVQTLSGGERQRMLLAHALQNQPQLLILDEPMQGLDVESEETLYAFVTSLPKMLQTAVVIVSHDIHWVMQGTDRVICLNKHICCTGKPSVVKTHPEFLGLYKMYGQSHTVTKTNHSFYQHTHQCDHDDSGITQTMSLSTGERD